MHNIKKKMTQSNRKIYRAALLITLFINVIAAAFYYIWYIDQKIPDNIMLIENKEEQFDFNVPLEGSLNEAVDTLQISNSSLRSNGNVHFTLSDPVTACGESLGSYKAELKLFGLIHYKDININVIEEQEVMPSGKAVGLYVNADGIMVLGTSQIEGEDGFNYEPAADILQSGDYIYSIDGQEVNDIDEVVDVLQQCGEGKVTIKLKRGKNIIKVKVNNIMSSDGQYKIGVWLREDTEGIGTITYVTDDNKYAALGHGITDIDTGLLIDIKDGGVYPATIQQIVQGKSGSPGELIGSVRLGDSFKLGTISNNTMYGIAGEMESQDYQYDEDDAIKVGLKQDVTTGAATVMCELGDTVESYEIEIEKIYLNAEDNKGMVLKVTDKKLLNKAGGIVQGMSGSPIIQNGKIIGAVTHVFVNDATRGYGIFIENMLE